MLDAGVSGIGRAARRILCLGAHCDDIEIGCGGTLLKLLGESPDREITWVVFASNETRAAETRRAAELFLRGAAKRNVVLHAFRDGFLPKHWAEVKEAFERLKADVSGAPDLIFTHFRQDLHQDHRIVSELTWNTFRDHLILEYEIPKFDGDLGAPNAFTHLDEPLSRRKASGIVECYPSQAKHAWFSEDTFLSMMRIRGVEANAPGKFAEAFYCRKWIAA
jgi:LmbE family N-acetylglucosaminyl deacetylase